MYLSLSSYIKHLKCLNIFPYKSYVPVIAMATIFFCKMLSHKLNDLAHFRKLKCTESILNVNNIYMYLN